MKLTDAQVQKVLSHGGSIQTSQLGMNLMLTRLKGMYAKQPTPATVSQCASEINGFLQKFAAVMQKDYEALSGI